MHEREFDPLILQLDGLDDDALATAAEVAARLPCSVSELPDADGTRDLAEGLEAVLDCERVLRDIARVGLPHVVLAYLEADAPATLQAVGVGIAAILRDLEDRPGSEVLAVAGEAVGREIRRRARLEAEPISVDSSLN
jgi:hypothetical protein